MLRQASGALLVLTAAAALGPAPAQTGKKPAPQEKMYNVGAFAGKVLDIDEDDKSLKVKVYGKTAVPTFSPGNPRS